MRARCARSDAGSPLLPFAHGAGHPLRRAVPSLFDSYHCSRYNTNTGVLTTGDVPRSFRGGSRMVERGAGVDHAMEGRSRLPGRSASWPSR